MAFPPLKSGDRITRDWFNKLISYMNSLSLSGDGITTRVSHGSAGTVVSAVPQIAEADRRARGGSIPTIGEDFIVTATGALTLHVSRGRVVLPSGVLTLFSTSGTTITMPSASSDYYLVVVYLPISVEPGIIGNVYISAAFGLTMPFDCVHQATIAKVTISGGTITRIQQIKSDPVLDRFVEFDGQVVPYYSSGLPYGVGVAPPAVIADGDGSAFYVSQVDIRNGIAVNPKNAGQFYEFSGRKTIVSGKGRLFVYQTTTEAPSVSFFNDTSDLAGKYGCYLADIAISNGKCTNIVQHNYGTAVLIEI